MHAPDFSIRFVGQSQSLIPLKALARNQGRFLFLVESLVGLVAIIQPMLPAKLSCAFTRSL